MHQWRSCEARQCRRSGPADRASTEFEIVVWDRVAPLKAHSFVRVSDVPGSPDKIDNGSVEEYEALFIELDLPAAAPTT